MRLLATAVLTMIVLSAGPGAARGEEKPVPDSIQQVKQRHEDTLMSIPGVVSVGIGKDEVGRPVIVVGLEHDSAETRRRLPQRLEDYEVRARVTGPVRAQ